MKQPELALALIQEQEAERLANPFYSTLRAQKEERDAFMKQHKQEEQKTLALLPIELYEQPEDPSPGEAEAEKDGAFDVFKHTYVDIDEVKFAQSKKEKEKISEQNESKSDEDLQSFVGSSIVIEKDIFCFYNLRVNLPKTFFDRLGQSDIVSAQQSMLIEEFVQASWPVFARRKMVWKVVFNTDKEVFNAVPTGSKAPLSKCCKMSLCFQFTRYLGGKVLCLESLCARNPID